MKRGSTRNPNAKRLNRVLEDRRIAIKQACKLDTLDVSGNVPREKLDLETMRALTSKMRLYPGSFVEDMRAAGEL